MILEIYERALPSLNGVSYDKYSYKSDKLHFISNS